MTAPSETAPGGTLPQPSAGEQQPQGGPATTSQNAPVITNLQLKPERVSNADSLRIIAEGNSKSGNEVTFQYEWMKNGVPSGESTTFTGFKRGDKISVKVTPYDGQAYGPSRTVTTEIGNSSPAIIEHRDMLSAGKVFSYRVKATDPDGDTLLYSLKTAPQGMTIDSATGLIQWNVPDDFKGKTSVLVSVTDGHGGEVFQSFSVDVKAEKRPQ